MKLSVLDQSTAATGKPEDQALRDTIELAKACETWGYHRFWVSEHHNHPSIVGTAPEILMAAIGQATNRIRIGSAGVMLPHYAPLKVAEQFRVLEAIAPGRVDLGLGRAPGSDGKTACALNQNALEDAQHFPTNVRDLMAWVSGQPLVDGHPFGTIRAHPMSSTSPEIWILGTSDYGAQVAAHLGIPYCFAHFITDGRGVQRALRIYRENYKPSDHHPEPIANVCVWALIADTSADAERLFAPRAHWKLMREKGNLRAIDCPKTIADIDYNETDLQRLDQLRQIAILGDADTVSTELREIATACDVNELVILTWTYEQADRRRSYELLAGAFNLSE